MRRYEFRLAAGRKHTSDVSESSENSLFRGFCVFPERDCLCHNGLRSKEFNGIYPKSQCKLRHFRDSEKRLPYGIRTGDLRHRSRKKIPIFSKIRGQFAPLPGDNPDRGNGSAWIFFGKIFRFPRTLSRTFSDIRGGEFQPCLSSGICGLCRWGSEKNGFFFKKQGPFFNMPGSNPDREFVCESGKNLVFFREKEVFY